MYIILDNNYKFIGFSLKEEVNYQNIEITEQEHNEFMEKQAQGCTLYFNEKNVKLEAVILDDFEFINENSKIEKNIEAEKQYNNDTLLKLKREKIQLKKDIADFEEFEEDTAYLKEQLKEKETEIKELEEQLKKL